MLTFGAGPKLDQKMNEKETKGAGRPQIDRVRAFLIRNKELLNIAAIAKRAECTRENLYMYMNGSNLSKRRRELVINTIKPLGYKDY